eukprot:5221901-Pyramimonas_sp.AAC.1
MSEHSFGPWVDTIFRRTPVEHVYIEVGTDRTCIPAVSGMAPLRGVEGALWKARKVVSGSVAPAATSMVYGDRKSVCPPSCTITLCVPRTVGTNSCGRKTPGKPL